MSLRGQDAAQKESPLSGVLLRPRRCGSGFSLIELLVVLSTIALLSSLSLAALARAKNAASSVKCKSNLRQLGFALRLYVDDYQAYPSGVFFEPNRSLGWVEALGPYVFRHHSQTTRSGIFNCPAFRPNSESIDYGYNAPGFAGLGLGHHLRTATGEVAYSLVKEGGVDVPHDMIALGDSITRIREFLFQTGGTLQRTTRSYDRQLLEIAHEATRKTHARHDGTVNLLFCDGHVEALTLKKAFFEESDEALVKWNRDHEPHREEWRQALQW